MAKVKTGYIVMVSGLCFIAFYLIVRLLFLEDIYAALAQAQVFTLRDSAKSIVSGYLFICIIWIYSFKLGVLLTLVGGALKAHMESRGVWLFIIGEVLYLVLCYIPIGYYPSFFGIQRTIILTLFLFIVWYWMNKRPKLGNLAKLVGDLQIIGYFFLIVSTFILCGIFGIATFALKPEIMIKHGLQTNAIMLASHVMIELVLCWFFLFFFPCIRAIHLLQVLSTTA